MSITPAIPSDTVETNSMEKLAPFTGVVINILSFIKLRVVVCRNELEFFKYYFGRFVNGEVCFVFKTLDWKQVENMTPMCGWQVIRLEQATSLDGKIDLNDRVKCYALAPDYDKMFDNDEALLESFDRFATRINGGVRSVQLTCNLHPLSLASRVLEKFRELESLCLIDSETYKWDCFKCKHLFQCYDLHMGTPFFNTSFTKLTRLELRSVNGGFSDYFTQVSRHTPLIEDFTCYTFTSIFTSPEIFKNWKNLKEFTSVIYLVRGEITDTPNDTDITESFGSIKQLKHLSRIRLCGEEVQNFGVPICSSLKSLSIELTYASFSELLIDTILENNQLTRLKLTEGYWDEGLFKRLDPQKLSKLTDFSINSLDDEMAEHLSSFSSIRHLIINYHNLTSDGIEHILRMPNLQTIKSNNKIFNSKLDFYQLLQK